MLLRRLFTYSRAADLERESFSIFHKLSGKADASKVEKIVDEIMTLSLLELHELSLALNQDPTLEFQTLPLPEYRSPFPHPKHLFSGIDADHRPGMHSK